MSQSFFQKKHLSQCRFISNPQLCIQMNVFIFAQHVETEEKALQYASDLGLVNKHPPTCPRCNRQMKWESGVKRRAVNGFWRCRNRIHPRCSISMFDGSVLQHFQVTTSSFLKTLFCIAHGMSVEETIVNTSLSAPTVVRIHQMMRELMRQYNTIHKKRIGGTGLIVEIDECHLHSRKYGVGRIESSELWWVFGASAVRLIRCSL